MTSLYVHYPWCVRKCPYCDFNSHPLKPDTPGGEDYTRLLIDDLNDQLQIFADHLSLPFASVFFGGGTPSLMQPKAVAEFLAGVPVHTETEITLEANPGTREYVDFGALRESGVNRLSIGAQSFDDDRLQQLGRIHSAKETHLACEAARRGGFDNFNLDVMWGLPEQKVAGAISDLQQAIELKPKHISWYQLTIEPKTEFARRIPVLPEEALLSDMEAAGLELLQQAGFVRYEVSAFAQDGYQCKHNLNYWSFGDYVGVGAGAHGKVTRSTNNTHYISRTSRPSQPRLYARSPMGLDQSTIEQSELAAEFMLNALRLVEGVSFKVFEQQTGLPWISQQPTWQRLSENGLVRTDKICTTPLGLRYLDSVVAEFV